MNSFRTTIGLCLAASLFHDLADQSLQRIGLACSVVIDCLGIVGNHLLYNPFQFTLIADRWFNPLFFRQSLRQFARSKCFVQAPLWLVCPLIRSLSSRSSRLSRRCGSKRTLHVSKMELSLEQAHHLVEHQIAGSFCSRLADHWFEKRQNLLKVVAESFIFSEYIGILR